MFITCCHHNNINIPNTSRSSPYRRNILFTLLHSYTLLRCHPLRHYLFPSISSPASPSAAAEPAQPQHPAHKPPRPPPLHHRNPPPTLPPQNSPARSVSPICSPRPLSYPKASLAAMVAHTWSPHPLPHRSYLPALQTQTAPNGHKAIFPTPSRTRPYRATSSPAHTPSATLAVGCAALYWGGST
jgi:hypothetical protein